MKTIDKLRKFAEGGKVRKYGDGDELEYIDEEIDPFATPINPDIDAWKSARSAYRDVERGDGESYAAYRYRKALAK
jgi:hypothetical protein